MKVLVVDMTHGGTIIASEFLKIHDFEVFAWDIYSTLDDQRVEELRNEGLKFVGKEFLDQLNRDKSNTNILNLDEFNEDINAGNYQLHEEDFMIIAPVHCNLESEVTMTHHDAVGFLLKDSLNVPVIEVTGVKGKTSIVWMLKEIFKDLKPLVLSSLGVEVVEDGEWKVIKPDISITPASIIDAWKLREDHEVGICIFETSLGGTGLADVGILTNLVEDYSIAGNSREASGAKSQIFKSRAVTCELDSFNSKYSEFQEKTNTFDSVASVENVKKHANVNASQINLSFDKTRFKVDLVDFKTLGNDIINTSFELSTFAPALIHVNNVLAAVCASLTLEVPITTIKEGLSNFRGLKGRTSIRDYKGIRIIEEINPGLNVKAVKKALEIIDDMDDPGVIFGGRYGVTCEEIDEKSVSEVLDKIKEDTYLVLTDELGANVNNILKRDRTYVIDFEQAIECAIENGCSNLLLIYRSNFSDVKKR